MAFLTAIMLSAIQASKLLLRSLAKFKHTRMLAKGNQAPFLPLALFLVLS